MWRAVFPDSESAETTTVPVLLNGNSQEHHSTVTLVPHYRWKGRQNMRVKSGRFDLSSLRRSLTLPATVIAVSATLISAAAAGALCDIIE